MWAVENRARYDWSKLRYPTDLKNTEWALVAPLTLPAKRGGLMVHKTTTCRGVGRRDRPCR